MSFQFLAVLCSLVLWWLRVTDSQEIGIIHGLIHLYPSVGFACYILQMEVVSGVAQTRATLYEDKHRIASTWVYEDSI